MKVQKEVQGKPTGTTSITGTALLAARLTVGYMQRVHKGWAEP